MAPEQLAGDASADHRVDIYATGLLAYELLHGKSPYAKGTPRQMLAAVLTQDPTPLIEAEPEVPKPLSDLVMRCLAKEPEQRPASAKELLRELDLFSDDSGEVRTMERRVAHIVHTPTPTSGVTPVVIRDHVTLTQEGPKTPTGEVPVAEAPAEVPAAERSVDEILAVDIQPIGTAGLSGEIDYLGYQAPKKSRAGVLAGVVAVFALLAVGGFMWSQRGGDGALATTAETPVAPGTIILDSASTQPPAAAAPETTSMALLPTVDSQAIRDSIRRAARAAAAAKKAAAARKDSAKPAEPAVASSASRARAAAAAMLASESARKAFMKGATHKGGVLGTKRSGDLQTQIDALQPFLSQAGMSYQHFKTLVQGAGVNMFDEYGRMIPDALQQFASGG
jgi:hypothetical protein